MAIVLHGCVQYFKLSPFHVVIFVLVTCVKEKTDTPLCTASFHVATQALIYARHPFS